MRAGAAALLALVAACGSRSPAPSTTAPAPPAPLPFNPGNGPLHNPLNLYDVMLDGSPDYETVGAVGTTRVTMRELDKRSIGAFGRIGHVMFEARERGWRWLVERTGLERAAQAAGLALEPFLRREYAALPPVSDSDVERFTAAVDDGLSGGERRRAKRALWRWQQWQARRSQLVAGGLRGVEYARVRYLIIRPEWGAAATIEGTIGDRLVSRGELRQLAGWQEEIARDANGARWQDADSATANNGYTSQAQQIVNAGGVTRTTIELGGNDVCQTAGGQIPTKAQIQSHIDNTFSILANGLPSGARVVVASVPNIAALRTTMMNEHQFLFETCQDMWDLNTNRLHVTAVAGGFCNNSFFSYIGISGICHDATNFINHAVTDFITPVGNALTPVFGVKFPCGAVLSSSNTSSRTTALQLNGDINAALSSEVSTWNGRQTRVTFYYVPEVYNYQFTADDVSHLDCFHPSRNGQGNLAATVWNSYYQQATSSSGNGTITHNTTAPALTAAQGSGSSGQWSSWWSGPDGSGNYQINTQFNTTKGTRIDVYLENCWNSSSPYYTPQYIGTTTNENPNSASFGVYPITGAEYSGGWWSTDLYMTDTSNNRSPFQYSPTGNPNPNGKVSSGGRWCI